MTNYLFAIWEGGGAAPPVLSVAGALVREGHGVRVLADPVLAPEVEAAGARHVSWTRAPHRTDRNPDNDLFRDWEARTPAGAFTRVRDRLMFGPAADFAADVLEELEREPADVIASEVLLAGPLVAAQAAGLPHAVLSSTISPLPTPGVPPFGPGWQPARGPLGRLRDSAMRALGQKAWDGGLPALNAARAAHGLDPLEHALDQIRSADRVLLLTSRAFDFPARELPPSVRYVGPRLADPAWAGEWTPPAGDDPLVLVGMSSTFQDQTALLGRTVQALSTLPVQGLATTGPTIDPASVAAAPKVEVVTAAPHDQVLGHAAAVVTHAGHGTAIKALARGVPIVAAPMGRDQPDIAARVVAAGAGVRIRPSASSKAIAAAVRTVLDDPSYRQAARRMAEAIAKETREDLAVRELEALAASEASNAGRPAPGSGSVTQLAAAR